MGIMPPFSYPQLSVRFFRQMITFGKGLNLRLYPQEKGDSYYMKVNKLMWCAAITATVIASGGSLLAAEQNTKENRGQLGYRDYRFLTEAAHGGMMEARLAEIAKQKATSQAVRDFAERMVTDQSKA